MSLALQITSPVQPVAVSEMVPPGSTVVADATIVGAGTGTTVIVYDFDVALVQTPLVQNTEYDVVIVGDTTMLPVVAVVLLQCGVPTQLLTVSVTVSPGQITLVLHVTVGAGIGVTSIVITFDLPLPQRVPLIGRHTA